MFRKCLKYLALGLCIATLSANTVHAIEFPTNDPPPPVEEPSGGGGGGDSGDGGGGGSPGPPAEPEPPQILSYTPKVTVLHSLNALLAGDGTAIFFLPALEDFPVDLEDTCADVVTDDGVRHQFAVVYDGMFNNEVYYNAAERSATDTTDVARLQTSKKVYSMTDSSRALNILGYDILLSDENASIVNTGESTIRAEYLPTMVGDGPLTTKTIIMDLYKAVGQYEWSIKIAHGKDDSIAVSTHPIMQQISVLTNDEVPGGIITDEGATYVWATRTNANQYWERCQRDAIFDGGAHLYTKPNYVGNDVSVTFSKSENDTVSMAEFCSLARAIMELYGEPVLTEAEKEYMLQAFSLELPADNFDDEQLEDIEYLAAKGIIDPTDINFSTAVTLADIESLLLRIADVDSRLTFDIDVNMNSYMAQRGYVEAPMSIPNIEVLSMESIVNPYDSNMYDYFIEAVDGCTNFYLKRLSGLELDDGSSDGGGKVSGSMDPVKYDKVPVAGIPTTSTSPVSPIETDFVFACDRLMVKSKEIAESRSGSGYFDFKGMVQVHDKYYYHMQINREFKDVTVLYDYDPSYETLDTLKEYSLPNANGGVFEYSGGSMSYKTFDDAGFSDEYLDADRADKDYNGLKETESFLSSRYTWYRITVEAKDFTKAKLKDIGLDLNKDGTIGDSDIKFIDLLDNSGKIIDTPLELTYSDSPIKVYVSHHTDDDTVTMIIQSTLDEKEIVNRLILSSDFDKASKSSANSFYRHDDGSLLVSYEYLREAGLVSGFNKLSGADGIYLIAGKLQTNVVLHNDNNLIIVGDSIYGGKGETLYHYTSPTELYINYRACTGWTSDYMVFNQDGSLLPIVDNSKAVRKSDIKFTVKTVYNLYPSSSYNVGYTSGNLTDTGKFSGFFMNGSNALGSYAMVMSGQNNMDYLFVWHREGVKDSSGNVHSYDDAAARQKFKDLTSLSLSSVPDCYKLVMYSLNREGGEQKGFRYIKTKYHSKYTEADRVVGWVYTPPTYDSWQKALDAYVKAEDQLLPIAKVKSSHVNLNMNTCSDIPDGEQLPIGRLPYSMEKTGAKYANMMGVIKNGKVKEDTSVYKNLKSVVIYSAPVGVFQQIKGLGSMQVADSKGSSLYFGSSLASYKNGKFQIGGKTIEAKDASPAICVFKGLGSGSMYVVNAEKTSIGDPDDGDDDKVGIVITEPDNLIDWDAYTFGRLVENIDNWSSIALIFVLNVLPRVGMLLFFVLMLLSLIKDVKFWRTFCVKVFDVYSFLTFGKQNVETIEMKRVLVISLICFSLFLIIMDGQLFNFILWLCEFFIALTQR